MNLTPQQQLEKVRARKRISYYQLAKVTGIGQSRIKDILADGDNTGIDKIVRIARVLNVKQIKL